MNTTIIGGEAQLDRVRAAYARLIDTLNGTGCSGQASECAQMAVLQGLWRNSAQRPVRFVSSLSAAPVHHPRQFWITDYLERHWCEIRAELDRVTEPHSHGFAPVPSSEPGPQGEAPLLKKGTWDEVVFYEGGRRFAGAHALFPATSAVLEAIPKEARSAGIVMFSWLGPQSHIAPHCGYTNATLRVHLGVRVPPEPYLRVHDQLLTWTEGRCIVFDDSFEHEVWHTGRESRVVLLFDVFHPELSEDDKRELLAQLQVSLEERVLRFMRGRGLRRVVVDGTDHVSVNLDQRAESMVNSCLREAGIAEIELHGDRHEVRFDNSGT
jgi:aspartate beta-hydroxylase